MQCNATKSKKRELNGLNTRSKVKGKEVGCESAVPSGAELGTKRWKARLIIVRSDEVVLRWCHGHGKRSGNIRDGRGNLRKAGEVVVARLGRLLTERVEVLVLALKVFFVEVERLAILAGLVGSAMPADVLLALCA